MERSEVLELMGVLKLYGMRAAYDEIMGVAIKRQHEPPRIVGDLLQAEISEKQARSIKYQLTVAKLPLAKDIDDFDFTGTPINESLIRDLAGGAFVADQRNVVLVGGIGTGKSHLAIAIADTADRRGTPLDLFSFPKDGLPSTKLASMDHAAIYAQYVLGIRHGLSVGLGTPSVISARTNASYEQDSERLARAKLVA